MVTRVLAMLFLVTAWLNGAGQISQQQGTSIRRYSMNLDKDKVPFVYVYAMYTDHQVSLIQPGDTSLLKRYFDRINRFHQEHQIFFYRYDHLADQLSRVTTDSVLLHGYAPGPLQALENYQRVQQWQSIKLDLLGNPLRSLLRNTYNQPMVQTESAYNKHPSYLPYYMRTNRYDYLYRKD
ncbi:MAG TPA: hypothetical protein PLX35_01800 [Cyclobacteriaceae bacterium]|nr:hypothetical protein [Cyclobacteriaceae bacterium]